MNVIFLSKNKQNWHISLCWLLTKSTLLEEQWQYYLTRSREDKGVHTKCICPKINITVRLEFELAYYKSAIHRFNHYITPSHKQTGIPRVFLFTKASGKPRYAPKFISSTSSLANDQSRRIKNWEFKIQQTWGGIEP